MGQAQCGNYTTDIQFMQDKELDSDEEEKKQTAPKQPQTKEEWLKGTSGARPNTKIVIKGGTMKPSSEAELLK